MYTLDLGVQNGSGARLHDRRKPDDSGAQELIGLGNPRVFFLKLFDNLFLLYERRR